MPPTPSDPVPERAWAERIRNGDEAAYEMLFRAHYAPLCAFANGMLDAPEIVGDIAVTDAEVHVDSPRLVVSEANGSIRIAKDLKAAIDLTGTINGGAAKVEGVVEFVG